MRNLVIRDFRRSGIPKKDEWEVILDLVMDKKASMTATPDEIITKLVEQKAAIQRQNGLALDALHFAKTGGTGGNGGKAGKGGKSPKRDMRNNKGDNERKEKDLRKRFHCQRWGHITENCLSKERSDPPKPADTASKVSTENTLTLTTLIETYWMEAKSNASSSDWFIKSGSTTPNTGCWSMFITSTKYPPNMKEVKGYNGVTSFASGYGSVRLTCQLPDRKTQPIIVQEMVHLPGSFNLISVSDHG